MFIYALSFMSAVGTLQFPLRINKVLSYHSLPADIWYMNIPVHTLLTLAMHFQMPCIESGFDSGLVTHWVHQGLMWTSLCKNWHAVHFFPIWECQWHVKHLDQCSLFHDEMLFLEMPGSPLWQQTCLGFGPLFYSWEQKIYFQSGAVGVWWGIWLW